MTTLRLLFIIPLCIVLLLIPCAAGGDWGPTPNLDREAGTPRRDVIRGQRLEMGEAVLVVGEAKLSRSDLIDGQEEDDYSQVTARAKRRDGSEPAKDQPFEVLRVGDTIQMGDTILTGRGSLLEILFGLNGRIHLGEESKIRLVKISEVAGERQIIEKRRIILDQGTLRIRVRKNTARSSPVLVIGVGADIEIGRDDLNGTGGVDVVIVRTLSSPQGSNTTVILTVLNGKAGLSRKATLDRDADSMVVERGRVLKIPADTALLPPVEELPLLTEEMMMKEALRCAFSNESNNRGAAIPEQYSRELDGP